jgi:uncharacterized delta-60 repeat protein
MSKESSGLRRSDGAGISRMHLGPGIRIAGGEYLLKRMLGRGGLSEVWLAWSRKHEGDVALKFFPHILLQDSNVLERLRAETVHCHQLDHPAIVRVFEFVQDDESVAIAMEYVEGWSLAVLKVDREEKRYRASEIEAHIRQLCSALDHAHHDFSIVHRDLKPANLLMNAREQLKVTDFALAQIARAALTQQGHLVYGALGYMSPQQLRGEAPSVLDDVYALGATIYDLLTGAPPFYKGEILAQMLEQTPPRMSERLLEIGLEDVKGIIPPAWEATVAACLAKDPAGRPQSAGDVARLLTRSDEEALAWLLQPGLSAKPPAKSVTMEVPRLTAVTVPKSEAPHVSAPVAAQTAPASIQSEPASLLEPEPSAAPAIAEGAESTTSVLPVDQLDIPAPESAPIPNRIATLPKPLVIAVAAMLLLGIVALLIVLQKTARKPSPPAGSVDSSFKPGSGAGNDIRALALQPDEKIIVGGRFTTFDGVPMKGLARLATDGRLETNFSTEISGSIHAIALQPDGRILVGGDFQRIGGVVRRRIARLKSDGTLDTSFDGRAALNRDVRTLALQPDGKIIAGGSFDSAGGRAHAGVTRFNPSGTRDASFLPGTGANNMVWSVIVQKDGKIIIAGDFNRFNGVQAGRIARLNADGSLDESFNTGSGADATIMTALVLDDGSILAGGNFALFNGEDRKRIVHLKSNGSIDPAFKPAIGDDGGVRSIAMQLDGKFIVGGTFFTAGGVGRNYIARINIDGSLDSSFNPGEGPSGGGVWRVLVQRDRKILIAGAFANFNGIPSGRIVRLNWGR